MLDAFSQHAPHPYFEAKDGELLIGGRKVSEIAAEIGRTPFYVYDRAVMTRKVQEMRAALPAEVEIHYAMKANPMPEVVKHFCDLVDGIDVASAGEMDVALAAGMRPDLISFAGPGKAPSELARAVAAGIVIIMESELEMRRIAEIARRTGMRPKVAVRSLSSARCRSSSGAFTSTAGRRTCGPRSWWSRNRRLRHSRSNWRNTRPPRFGY
jgi:diaminopimelate decarboxylase